MMLSSSRSCFGQLFQQPFEIDVATGKEDGIVGAIVLASESQRIGGFESAHSLCLAQDVVSQRVASMDDVLKFIVDEFGRRVVVTLNLVADDLHLLVDFVLWIDAVEHDVAQQVDGSTEVLLHRGGVVDRALFGGESVQFAAHTLECVQDLERRTLSRPFESGVLAKVSQPLLSWSLVACASGNLVSAENHSRRVFAMNHAQSVGQSCSIVFHACCFY